MNKKAVVLMSGGLDSILAARLMIELGIEVEAAHYYIDFAACVGGDEGAAAKASKALGIPLKVFDITSEYLEMFKNPRYGYGANINPCIDCKIFMLKKAKEYMEKSGASFLVTGEVLGERPMSQRKDALNLIEKQAGVRGILLRPLSAKLLEPTLPEKEGVIDREKLLDIRGRSRKPQMALAEKFGIKEYPNPAGGCLLTDPGFTKRVKDLIKYDELNVDNLKLLKIGRHFRIDGGAKLIVGRDEFENKALESLAAQHDIILKLKARQGPISLLVNRQDDDVIEHAASIAAYHTKFRNENSIEVNFWCAGNTDNIRMISIAPANTDEVERLRI
ncbi:MAG: tRNA 4-thiouridine(8) synthase ThiI [Candidatus Omnitrophota bacterium]|jgi:tRNA U34 2-thiouridine synthase MnmA/TrmU